MVVIWSFFLRLTVVEYLLKQMSQDIIILSSRRSMIVSTTLRSLIHMEDGEVKRLLEPSRLEVFKQNVMWLKQ